MSNKPSNQSKVRRWIKEPFRFFGKVRNFYVRFMYDFSKWTGHGHSLGFPSAYFSSLPMRTFPSSNADDFQDLIRANAESKLRNRVGSKIEMGYNNSEPTKNKKQRRKCCDLIETIDEDKPCEFGDHLKERTDFLQQPRSRRSAVTSRASFVS